MKRFFLVPTFLAQLALPPQADPSLAYPSTDCKTVCPVLAPHTTTTSARPSISTVFGQDNSGGAEEPSSSGIVSLAALDTVCDLMREQFGHTLPLCCNGRTLLRALGHTTASDAQASGSIDIATFSSGFELIQVSSEAATGKPSIFGLLRHANKDSSLEAFAANVH